MHHIRDVLPGMLVADISHRTVGMVVGVAETYFSVQRPNGETVRLSGDAIYRVSYGVQLIGSATRLDAYTIE